MANVIKHKHNDTKVQAGDIVVTPVGERTVDFATYTWKGAAVWTRDGSPIVKSTRWAASECGCYVTSEDC